MDFYNWQKTLSYSQARQYVVIGAKGVGKTYGCRKLCIKDYLKTGNRFVEISRTKLESEAVSSDYFGKLEFDPDFSNYIFKTDAKNGYIAKKPFVDEDGEEEPPQWEIICYFVALSTFQTSKKKTYANVKSLIFDEFIIDSRDIYHRYLPSEWEILSNLTDSLVREMPGQKTRKPRLFLLANSCDLSCPYFENLGLKQVPQQFGYAYLKNKTVLLHYAKPPQLNRTNDTLVGSMLNGTSELNMIYGNLFDGIDGGGFIGEKPKGSVFQFALVFKRQKFAVWFEKNKGKFFINRNPPQGSGAPFYYLIAKDGNIDYKAIKKSEKVCQMLADLHYKQLLIYDNLITKEFFSEFLKLLGVL